METWFLIMISIAIAAFLKALINLAKPKSVYKLPPSPFIIPVIGKILWLRKVTNIELILRSLYTKLGPVVTLHIGTKQVIFIADRGLAHQALIQNGSVFSDRPQYGIADKILTNNQHNINSAGYGPTWWILRRNLTAEILHPSRVKTYANPRKWVLDILFDLLMKQSKSSGVVVVHPHFQHAMFCLLVLMCFGDKLSEEQIKQIAVMQMKMLIGVTRYRFFNSWTRITTFLLRNQWNEFLKLNQQHKSFLISLIRSRKAAKEESLKKTQEDRKTEEEEDQITAYVDTLWDLELSHENRKLNEEEMATLCSEFLNAGTDTTSTGLQWIMANLVKNTDIQHKLFNEIKGVLSDGETEVKESDLQKLPYLKAVILEGLRRHPPAHFLLPHTVTEETVLAGQYLIPKHAFVNVSVADIGWDPKVWENPMEFNPERFMKTGDSFDITGTKEIKMMPFGAGRRMCPAHGLAMLHLEYFVANLIWKFQWKAVDGDDVDLSEKLVFTVVMKNPLKACISPRFT